VGNKFLSDIRNTDALIHVLRCFDDDQLPHIDGSVNPVRDIETINLELQVKDLESVEKKMERLGKIAKSGDKDARRGLEVLALFKAHLEDFQNARTLEVGEADRKHVEDLFLLTSKPVLFVCNVEDEAAITGNAYVEQVKEYLAGEAGDLEEQPRILVLAARLESEISELEDEADRKEFLADAGLEEPGVNKLIRSAYSLLRLISFFTMGPKEIRAWTIRKGALAPEAAGTIHSDMQRGFIRAEVLKYEDLVSLGSEQACKDKGKLAVEGKNYVVQEADILHIRFNV
jgi:GTP-binding protein YchF